MEWQTEIRIPYEFLTPEQKKEICNGCGGKGGFIKPPLRAFFKTSCNHHDYGYWCGCTEAERKNDDKGLRKSMKEDVAGLPWYKKPLYMPWCYLYYRGVRVAGAKFFYWGKKKRWPVPTEKQKERLIELGIIKGITDRAYKY
jgi:hypothetical protein